MISFDLMQQQASIRLVRGEPMHGMAVNSMLGTAKNDGENWAFRFQRLTNVCLHAPGALFRPGFLSLFHQMVVLVVANSIYCCTPSYALCCAQAGNCLCISSNTIHQETLWNCL